MKKLIAVAMAAVIMLSAAGCSRFGPNDNPPMLTPAADDRNA